ncbi:MULTISPECIES: sensor histidine kinase [Pseudomonas fluorescens group]|uniref:Sensor histidine kinase n=1 Tax=Pseudomonas fluorescens TaxID=294 RepID=A0ACD4Y1N3_PSEFL|nr:MULTISPECIES: sensor histidine kinase [Pseudomonas fluorescens group]MBZ6453975.1 sensor histidine kinase [Pseudomonas fluorescens group sp.]MBZ6459961.1 sensor histidine kinase [Pseudomonas fluorescens group sp.]MBZ6466852.1 sensor histidine kinase [Pseudomonas fluorescens group sp.]WPN26374.1 sensor histidine kinase [Pseudomonas marginalis]WQD75138.1 sensor histidine kinase [Pseudomonas marginalis]
MQNTPHDPGSALAIRAHYRQSESRTARLRLLVDTGQALPQLAPEAMRERVLSRACAFLAMDHGLIQEWDAEGGITVTARHGSQDRLSSLAAVADRRLRNPCWLELPGSALPSVLQVPLRGGDGDALGVLVLGNSVSLRAPDHEDSESLQLLATLLAAHLQNDRLLTTLKARDRTLSDLVNRLLRAQEDERKRVAYDLHDGLAQTLAGLHQRLQGFAGRCPTLPGTLNADLQAILTLAQHSVGEGRQLIAGLRPTVLDDFGLFKALDKEADRLREAAVSVQWSTGYAERLPSQVEIALFRIGQEAINNVLKHAQAGHVQLALALHDGQVSLRIDDNGKGFDPGQPLDAQDAQHLGLATMHERASLLGGQFICTSAPGGGTQLHARVPAPLNGMPQ